MGIEPNFDFNGIEEYMREQLKKIDQLILRNLNYLGMRCVNIAKTRNTYVDRTANLRNSIGYVIVKNGQVTKEFFANDGRGIDWKPTDEKGEDVGKQFATEVAQGFTQGYALIVVAGMNYASYVEDVHHLDVLQSAETFAINEAPRMMKKLEMLK